MKSHQVPSTQLAHDGTLFITLEALVGQSLLRGKLKSDTMRVWVVGCGTGEMAYAVTAGLLAAMQRDDPPTIQVFATDADADALAIARAGRYTKTLSAIIPPEHLARFFLYEQPQHRVSSDIRNLITFAQHTLLDNPPLGNMDLIVWWHPMGKRATNVQNQLMRQFHWSLRANGYLLLCTDESNSTLERLFSGYGDGSGLFQRRVLTPMVRFATPLSTTTDWREAKDALQSTNEHLHSVSNVLRRKIDTLDQANNDLSNFMRATGLPVIFLNEHLQIVRYTPPTEELFNLIPADIGRPFAHISGQLNYPDLVHDAETVLADLQNVEREIMHVDGRWFLVRMRPYRTVEERVVGVMIICTDISARRAAEAALQQAHDVLELRVQQRTAELTTTNEQLQHEVAQRRHLEQERMELMRKNVATQEEERRRIARELHDQLAQSVTAFRLGLNVLPSIEGPAEQQQLVARLQAITTQLDHDIHRLALDLRPAVLDHLGIVAAIESHLARWMEATGIHAAFAKIGQGGRKLSPEIEIAIFRVVQEALTNVYKHAAAREVSVILEHQSDHVQVIVEDDGRGFDVQELQQAQQVHHRLGLMGMQERVALVNGTITFETHVGAGTTVFVRIPLPPQQEDHLARA